MPVVIVEVEAREASPQLVRAMIAACSAALGDGRCEIAGEPENEGAEAVAIVRWRDGAERTAEVEVAIRRGGGRAAWQSRALDFHREDSRLERWRSVGLTIATLAGEGFTAEGPAADPTAPGESSPPGPDQPSPRAQTMAEPVREDVSVASPATSPSRTTAAPGPRAWLGAGAGLGSAIAPGVQLGGHVEGGYQLAAFFGRASLGLSSQPGGAGEATVQWLTGSLSAGVWWNAGPVTLRPRVGVRAERIAASIERRGDASAGSAAHLQLGVLVGADATLSSGSNGVVLGAEIFRNRAPAELRIGASTTGTYSATGWGITIGYRYIF